MSRRPAARKARAPPAAEGEPAEPRPWVAPVWGRTFDEDDGGVAA